MDDTKKKKIIALSKAVYRNVTIFETAEGYVFFWKTEQYCKATLKECTASIDEFLKPVWTAEMILEREG
jgi:hypothetical protein